LLGEWFIADHLEDIVRDVLRTGGSPTLGDAYAFNGFPGPTYKCSTNSTCTPAQTLTYSTKCVLYNLYSNVMYLQTRSSSR
jgi:hypothetical protein